MLPFLIVCIAIAAAGGRSGDDPTHPPFLLLRCGTDSSSSSTSAQELTWPRHILVRRDSTELESTSTYKILYNVYNIFKINILTILCLNDFTNALRRRDPNVNRQDAANLIKALPGSRITLLPDEHTLKFVGQSAVWFATKCGIVIRRDCPMQYHCWKDAPEDVKAQMIHRLAVSSIN